MQDNQYDIIIIGSGLGGLECGVILGKEGYRVCVAEQSHTPGGCLQSFERDGRVIDTGLHYAGSMGEGQILRQYLTYLGVMDSLEASPMDSCFDMIELGKAGQYHYCNGYNHFYEYLINLFPDEKEGIKKYLQKIYEIGSSICVENHSKGILSAGAMRYLGESAWFFIQECVTNPVLQQLLCATNLLYAGNRESSTLYHHAMTTHSNLEGAYRFAGGSRHIARALTDKIQEQGGTVLTNSKVVALHTHESKIQSLRLENGELLFANQFISDIHPAATFSLINDTPAIKKAFRTRLSLLPDTYSVFSVYLVMKENTSRYENRNFYFYNECNSWDTVMNSNCTEPKMTMLSFQRKNNKALFNDVATIMTPMYFRDFEQWAGTSVGRRGEDYRELKTELIQKITNFTYARHAGLKEAVEKVYAASPLTYFNYLGARGGSAYGLLKDYRNPVATLFPARTKLENLLLTGQNLNVHGALGVTLSAAVTCSELIGSEYLAKKVASV